MKTINLVREMQQMSLFHKANGQKIAVVPTMGFLHDGHLSLIHEAKKYADIVITTIFVNPTQFGPDDDYEEYPRDINNDKILAEKAGSDYVFIPNIAELYPPYYDTTIKIGGITNKFEGNSRPDHFDGVSTIVSKLFNATLPDFAMFGQKDFQQTLLIKRLVKDLNFPIKIIVVETKREESGLAMSSRNKYLDVSQQKQAATIYKALIAAKTAIENGEKNRSIINHILYDTIESENVFRIDYVSSAVASTLYEPEVFRDGDTIVLLVAAYLDETRLIDNMIVKT